MKLKIASRKSALALWQAHFIGKKLQAMDLDYEIIEISTEGDRIQNRYLHEIGGKGLFVKEVERALHDGRADLAVHSLKDMPVNLTPGYDIVATPLRHKRHDILLLGKGLASSLTALNYDELSRINWQRIKIGTSSLRRRYQLKKNLGAHDFSMLRGNVNTRLQKLESGQHEAIILAAASIERLGINYPYLVDLNTSDFVPCAGQGALAIQMHCAHPLTTKVKELNDPVTFAEVQLERAILRALGGDCTMPCGVHAYRSATQTTVSTIVLESNGLAASCKHTFKNEEDINDMVRTIMKSLASEGLAAIFKSLKIKLPGDLS